MAFHFLLLFSLLNLAFAGNHGALPEEVHWKSVFPNTPMPKALKDLLPPAGNKNPSVGWTKRNSNAPRFSEGVNGGDPIHPFIMYGKESKGVNGGDPVHPFIMYGKESKGNKNSLDGNRNNAAINETTYFFQEDLHPGKMVKLPLLTKTRDMTTFLPHRIAESIPFSSEKLPQILKHFSFEIESREANIVKETIKDCEREVIDGEQMYCATSFESFVDWSVSKLGKNIQLLSNELRKETKNPVFTIGRGIKDMGEKEIVCHKMEYPYAVFLCHSIDKTAVYRVPLVGIDGTKVDALAICHKDTSAWSPDLPAFLILKVKPGTVPICHFVVRDTVVWVRK